jgi:hypothetical protein
MAKRDPLLEHRTQMEPGQTADMPCDHETGEVIDPRVAEREKALAVKKAETKTDYERALAKVMEAKAMTDTPAWRELYKWMQAEVEKHKNMLLDVQKPTEIAEHQQGVKVVRALIEKVQAPVDDMRQMLSEPLFSRECHTRATWNEPLGRIELVQV